MIDLAPISASLAAYLSDSISRFALKHPDAQVSCIALYVTPYGGDAYINFETPQHSDQWVAEHQALPQGYIQSDSAGTFCSAPNDFAFGQEDYFPFPGFPNLHEYFENNDTLSIRDSKGQIYEVDSYDESIGRVLFEMAASVLRDFNGFGRLNRTDVFRLGVCVHNTDIEKFWIHEAR